MTADYQRKQQSDREGAVLHCSAREDTAAIRGCCCNLPPLRGSTLQQACPPLLRTNSPSKWKKKMNVIEAEKEEWWEGKDRKIESGVAIKIKGKERELAQENIWRKKKKENLLFRPSPFHIHHPPPPPATPLPFPSPQTQTSTASPAPPPLLPSPPLSDVEYSREILHILVHICQPIYYT